MTARSTTVILLAFANDRDDRARYLRNLPEEARQVQRALAAAEQRSHCELVLRQNVTAADILDLFQDERYRDRISIFHFGGHADGYRLLLETAEGAAAAANAGGLARFLAQQRGLQLVFLNGCSTEGQVAGLLDAGVSAVIATDQAIDDAAATAFAARFYQGLAGGAAIAAAYEEAKAAMQMAGVPVYRHIGAVEDQQNAGRLPWRLHLRPGAEIVQDWSLPLAARDPLFGLPDLPPLELPDKPYRYLDWYRREDAPVFFGRGREIRELYDRVTAPGGPPIVLFYGQSGAGKSSLLAAGLLPRLEGSHTVRYARRDQATGLLGTLAQALDASPADDLAAAWRGLEAQAGRPLLVVLDQVEEIFTRPHPQQADELEQALEGLEALFADASRRPQGRLILGFRKERLSEIKERLIEHKLPRAEVFLERLGREGIAEVVAGPGATPKLADHYRLTVADALPGLIADDLLADRESPVAPMLAILLADMWEAAKRRNYDRPAFYGDLYHEFRSRGLSLDDFLGRQLQALHDKQPEVVASGLALDLLAYHTTPLGTAEQRTQADLEQNYNHRWEVLPSLVQECRDLYLLVDPAQNQPGQPPSSRLTHDTLAPHVRKRFDESDAPGQRARRILESRKLGWQSGKMGVPLDSTDLNTVENGLAGLRELSQDEGRLISASRKLAERNRRNRLLLLMTLSALFFIVTVIALQATIYPILLMQTARMDGYPVSVGALKIKIEAYEVTNQRYRWCFNAGICSAPSSQLTTYFQSSADHMPITGIDAIQAAVFCDWIQRRLPKVDEWQSIIEFTGVNEKISPEMANLCYENCESSTGKPHEVGSYLDGITGGIYDLIGNVFEWTRTEMNDKSHQGNEWTYAKSAPVPSDLAIVGGSYLSDARGALVASRQSGQPAEYVGVRCVETLELH